MQYSNYQQLATDRSAGRSALTEALRGRSSERQRSLEESTGFSRLASQIGEGENNLAGIRRNIYDTDANVTDRGRGSFMTEAQRQRQVVAEQQPLRETYARTQEGLQPVYRAYTSANEALQSGLRSGMLDDERELQTFDANTSLLERALQERLSAARSASSSSGLGATLQAMFGMQRNNKTPQQASQSGDPRTRIADFLKSNYFVPGIGISDGLAESQIIPSLLSDFAGSGLSSDELISLFYNTRKGFENVGNRPIQGPALPSLQGPQPMRTVNRTSVVPQVGRQSALPNINNRQSVFAR